VEAEEIVPRDPALRPTRLRGILQFISSHGRVVLLHRVENLADRLRETAASQDLPEDVRVDLIGPGQEADAVLLSLPLGRSFPAGVSRFRCATSNCSTPPPANASRLTSGLRSHRRVCADPRFPRFGDGPPTGRAHSTSDDLVANVTHELKTPLSSMRLLVETLLNSPQLNEKTAREYLELIAKENLRLSRLIDNS